MAVRRRNRVTKKKRGGVHPPTSNLVVAKYISDKRATAKANWLARPPRPPGKGEVIVKATSVLPPIDDDVDAASRYNDMTESMHSSQASIKSKSNPLPPPPVKGELISKATSVLAAIDDDVDAASHYNDMTESVHSSQASIKSKTSPKLSKKISPDQGKSYLDRLIESSGVDKGKFITHLKGLNKKNIISIHAFFKRNFEVPQSSHKYDTMVDLLKDARVNELVCEAALMQE